MRILSVGPGQLNDLLISVAPNPCAIWIPFAPAAVSRFLIAAVIVGLRGAAEHVILFRDVISYFETRGLSARNAPIGGAMKTC